MKALQLLICASVLATAATVAAQDIYLLGDSLSDSGDGYATFAQLVLQTDDVYPQDPYYEGRWTNGPTWIENAVDSFGNNLYNYAAGGATTGTAPAQVPALPAGFGGLTQPTTVLSPNIYQQFNNLLLDNNSTLDSDAFYVILIGINDYLSTVFQNTNVTSDDVSSNIEAIVGSLADYGAVNFVFGLLPTVDTLPVFNNPSLYGYYNNASVSNINDQIAAHNSNLQDLADSIYNDTDGYAYVFDFGQAVVDYLGTAQQDGISNVRDACYVTAPQVTGNSAPSSQPIGLGGGQQCSDPDAHLFWDQLHFASKAHASIGDAFVNQFSDFFNSSDDDDDSADAPAPSVSTTG